MDLDYSNDMINSSTDRITTEHWVKHFWYISIIQSWHNVGKSGRDFKKWVWQAVYIFHGELFSS